MNLRPQSGLFHLGNRPAVNCEPSAVRSPTTASSFNFQLSTFNSSPLSPFPATLTSTAQLIENPSTLSPLFAALTTFVTAKSFVCHSYRKTRVFGKPCKPKVSLRPQTRKI